MRLWNLRVRGCSTVVLGLDAADAAVSERHSGLCPEVWCEVLYLPHRPARAQQERLHVQAARLPHAAGRDGRDQTGAEDLRAGQGHQVQPHPRCRADPAGQRDCNEKTVADAGQHHLGIARLILYLGVGMRHLLRVQILLQFQPGRGGAVCGRRTVPETGFSYFGHYELYQGGTSTIWSRASASTRRGRANNELLHQGR
jgi:hypothetical protein